jgi:ribonuclease HI
MDTILRFQHPCGICRPTPVGVCTIAHSQENCPCGALAWCCCNCDRHFCVACFQNTDDKFLSSFKISEADWHPYTLRNIPLRVSAHNPDYFPGAVNLEPLEPQTPFSFSLYAPEETTCITIQLSMPWPSLRIDRDGISILPPSVWPRATHGAPDINAVWHPGQAARAAREYSLVVALQNAQCTQENARLHSEESRRLEMEGDCGVELNPLRNCRPQDTALYAHRLAHRPPSHLPRPSLSVFRKEASELADVLPPVASWPLYVAASAFTWPCGECRVQRDACFRKPAICASDALCACFELAVILCVECNTHLCYDCFINMDEYFLHSFKLTRTTRELFQLRNLPIPTPRPPAQAKPSPSDSESDGDECGTEAPSQSSYQELLIESRRGSAAEACKLLFAPPSAIVMANGYAMNDFVAADSDVESSTFTQTESDASWVDSCPNLCEECGQLLPSSQVQRPMAARVLPAAQRALTDPATAALLPSSAFSLAAQAILTKATSPPLVTAAKTPQQRIFVFAPPQALPLLPPLTRIMASVAAATRNPSQPPTVTPPDAPLVGIHHNPGPQDPNLSLFVIAAPPTARIAGILTHPGPLDLPPTRLRTAAEPQCVYCSPAAPLVGIEKNPGPVQQAKSTFPAPQRNSSSRVVFDSPEDHPVAPAAAGTVHMRGNTVPDASEPAPQAQTTHSHGTRRAAQLEHGPPQHAAPPLPTRQGSLPLHTLGRGHSQMPVGMPGLCDNSDSEDLEAADTRVPQQSTNTNARITRLRTPSARFLDIGSHTLTPLDPLRRLAPLQHALAEPPATTVMPTCSGVALAGHANDSNQATAAVTVDDAQRCREFLSSINGLYPGDNLHPTSPSHPESGSSLSHNADRVAFERDSIEDIETFLGLSAAQRSIRTRHRRPSLFPLALTRAALIGPVPPPHMGFRLDCTLFTDGGFAKGVGSWAVLARSPSCTDLLAGPIAAMPTNNLAEFTAILEALRFAHKKKYKRVLIVSDSEIAINFLKGLSKIDAANLFDVTSSIVACLSLFEAVFASHVTAHANIAWENDVVDSLCTWVIASKHHINSLRIDKTASNLLPLLARFYPPTGPSGATPSAAALCPCCSSCNHSSAASCPLTIFTTLFAARHRLSPCPACLSGDHDVAKCPLMALPKRVPCPSLLLPTPRMDPQCFGPMTDLLTVDFSSLRFPQKQNHEQFLDYWITVFAKLLHAPNEAEADAACRAAEAWSQFYRVEGFTIRMRNKSHHTPLSSEGSNINPPIEDADLELAKRAMRAARLGPDARVSDVSKALRKGRSLPLTEAIIAQLKPLYPPLTADDTHTNFDAPPISDFAANRAFVARAVLSRSPNSHPGKLGITFGVLQLFCNLTYKRESANSPDQRWSLFCDLISEIMTGNAVNLSKMFHDVVGVFFDKNFEKPSATPSLRNIGIEESLVRVASALVFQDIIQDATAKGFLSCWELGCGVKGGAEIFGRIAAVAADNGMIVSVFDVTKAFNNLRRCDIKDAVDNFANPLLSAFVSYLFERDPTVCFRDPLREHSFTAVKGILQGNPLSTFLFSLTIAWILKPFRALYPLSLTPSYIDDLELIGKPTSEYPPMLEAFMALFRAHGLHFDLSDAAKSSVFSVLPLPDALRDPILNLGVKCQQVGISPCKIPYGNPNFILSHVAKQQDKFMLRFSAFKALWPAMLKLKPTLKQTRIGVYEAYLNLLRLSLLSMSSYTLRTVSPQFCAPYATMVSSRVLELIDNVFPPRLHSIGTALPFGPAPFFPPMMEISLDIMQLPLSLGGLSLRLPSDTYAIAYAASCGECVPYLHAAALRLGFVFASCALPGLSDARALAVRQVDGYLVRKPKGLITFERSSEISDPTPLQENLTTLLNHAMITRIAKALDKVPLLLHAFLARVDKDQSHCSWPFNPVARRNLKIAALADEDFSRAIQIAMLRPITSPRLCDCKAVIDPVGLHLLHCRFVHFGYMHDCVKTALVAVCKSFQPLDLSAVSVVMERPVARFYPLKNPLLPEGPAVIADIVVSLADTAQQECVIADVSSVLSRGPSISSNFHAALRARSQAKRLKYAKYAIPSHLFHPVTVGRTNVLSSDALAFCFFIGNFFPTVPKAADRLRAAISRAICVGAARTFNTTIRRSQLAVLTGSSFPGVPKSAACARFAAVGLPSSGVVRLRGAEHDPSVEAESTGMGGASRVNDHRAAACSLLAADSRPGGGVVRRLHSEQVPLSAHPRSLEVSAVNGLPYQQDALQHTVAAGGSTGEFTVAVGVVDR